MLLSACTATDAQPEASPTPPVIQGAMTFFNAPGDDLTDQLLALQSSLGIELGDETRSDRYGSWNPLSLVPGAALLTVDHDNLTTDDPDYEWNFDQIDLAWAVVARFLIEQWVDSEVVWEDSETTRAAAAARVSASGLLFDPDVDFADYLVAEGGNLTPTAIGPWALDQDWSNWRQDGVPPEESDDPAVIRQNRTYAAGLTPAEPAPYQAGQPRTFVLGLAPLAVYRGSDDDNFVLRTEIVYYRPLAVAGVATPRYEATDAYLSFQITIVGGAAALVTGFVEAQISHVDVAAVALADLDGLNQLAPADDQLSANLIDDWYLTLPSDIAADDDLSCAVEVPEEWTGSYVTFDLPAVGDDPTCLEIISYPADIAPELSQRLVPPTTSLWSLSDPALSGFVSVDALPDHDIVTINAVAGDGARIDLSAVVAPGTGQDWAAPLVASLRRA
jgi:hypothetical protein